MDYNSQGGIEHFKSPAFFFMTAPQNGSRVKALSFWRQRVKVQSNTPKHCTDGESDKSWITQENVVQHLTSIHKHFEVKGQLRSVTK